jgi:MscS family membrane protein
VVLDEMEGLPIVLARQPDGRWRFDAGTVGRIGKLRKLSSTASARPRRRAPAGRGADRPVDDLRTFAAAAMGRRDFTLAAGCLDLRDVPPKLRASRGRRWRGSSPS